MAQGEVGWAVGCTAAAQLAAACLAAAPAAHRDFSGVNERTVRMCSGDHRKPVSRDTEASADVLVVSIGEVSK